LAGLIIQTNERRTKVKRTEMPKDKKSWRERQIGAILRRVRAFPQGEKLIGIDIENVIGREYSLSELRTLDGRAIIEAVKRAEQTIGNQRPKLSF